jgi:AcrR family transcriptional regulator
MSWITHKNKCADEILLLSKSPKILALYNAVIALLDEGADISSLKVSDITSRAGIGKGTAYDYFRSKEEIIVKAMIYDVLQGLLELQNMMDKQACFYDKFHCFLRPGNSETVCKQHTRIKRYIQYFYQDQTQNLSGAFKQTLEEISQKPDSPNFSDIFTELYQAAVQENLARAGLDLYRIRTGLLTQLLSFIHYEKCLEQKICSVTDDSEEQIIQYLYENLIYMWR